jgi:hypothetical protein
MTILLESHSWVVDISKSICSRTMRLIAEASFLGAYFSLFIPYISNAIYGPNSATDIG